MFENLDKPPTVLIADDEQGLLELFSAYLEPHCEVITARNGRLALELVDDAIDVAIFDRRMPDKTGDEVLRDVRSRGYQFPVAMLTAVKPDTDIIEIPFDAYVNKPVDRKELLGVVKVLVHRQSYDESTREFFRLATKKVSLETNPQVDSGPGSEFRELVDRMNALRKELNDRLEQLIEVEHELKFD